MPAVVILPVASVFVMLCAMVISWSVVAGGVGTRALL